MVITPSCVARCLNTDYNKAMINVIMSQATPSENIKGLSLNEVAHD